MIPRLTLLTFVLGSNLLSAASYRFSLEGRDFDPKILPVLGTRKGDYTLGDIGRVGNFPFVLHAPGHYQFHFGNEGKAKLFCRIDGGASHCVGVRITQPQGELDGNPPLINPLSTMTPKERSRLWSVVVDGEPLKWDPILRAKGLDWSATALGLDYGYNGRENRALPALPAGLRYLSVQCEGVTGLDKLTSLQGTRDLRFLDLRLFDQALDLSFLGANAGLLNLSISGGSVRNTGKLADLSKLRFLKLRRTEDLNSVAFVTSLPELRVFKIDSTAVTDLRLLAHCPQLRLLSATGSLVEYLPDGKKLPKLRDVRLLATPVATRNDQTDALRKTVPGCTVHTTWEDSLRSKLARVNHLRVRSGETSHREREGGATLFEIKDGEKIQNLINRITINQERSGFHCMCYGDPCLEFYEGNKLVATLGFHHGQSLRWDGGLWPGDANVSKPSARLLCNLIAAEGHHGPQEQLRETIARERATPKDWEPSIKAFEEADREAPPPENPILFLGSSSIRKWDLSSSFPDHFTINRGFGGSELSDAIRYFDRIVLPSHPRIIFLYAGDNDINRNKTAEQVVADYQTFAQLVRSKIPATQFAFIAIKPSIKRWHLWPEMKRANEMIHDLSQAHDNLHCLDIASPMLGPDGKLIREFFEKDGLHLNPAGYRVWTKVVTGWLEKRETGF